MIRRFDLWWKLFVVWNARVRNNHGTAFILSTLHQRYRLSLFSWFLRNWAYSGRQKAGTKRGKEKHDTLIFQMSPNCLFINSLFKILVFNKIQTLTIITDNANRTKTQRTRNPRLLSQKRTKNPSLLFQKRTRNPSLLSQKQTKSQPHMSQINKFNSENSWKF